MARQRRIPLRSVIAAAIWLPFVDETIQLFVRGRSGQISDVWLDLAGMWTGLGLMCLLGRARSHGNRRRLR